MRPIFHLTARLPLTYLLACTLQFDAHVLKSFVDSIFQPAAFDGAPLVPASTLGAALPSPEGTQVGQYLAWASTLPDRNPTSWLNLAESSAKAIASANGPSWPFFF